MSYAVDLLQQLWRIQNISLKTKVHGCHIAGKKKFQVRTNFFLITFIFFINLGTHFLFLRVIEPNSDCKCHAPPVGK